MSEPSKILGEEAAPAAIDDGRGAGSGAASGTPTPERIRFDFSDALRFVKHGAAFRRACWDDKSVWVGICHGVRRISVHGGQNAEYTEAPTGGFLVLKAQGGPFMPWMPSQADLLADDWEFAWPLAAEACAGGAIPEPNGIYRFSR